jgi:phosphoribosylformylglycinamidine synthase
MGAAGLTCSTCEMGARGELGVTIELDKVPQRETGMTSYEIMLSESQERMLLVAAKGREKEVTGVFAKWGLDCAEVGIVTADDVMRVYHGGVLQAEIPNKALTDDAPVYHRPVGVWKAPVPLDPPVEAFAEFSKPRDYTADLKTLLASVNIASKAHIFEQYDSMVQTNTVQGPGGEAGVIRVKGTGYHVRKKEGILAAITDLIAESTPRGEAAMQAADPAATADASRELLSVSEKYVAESTPQGESALQAERSAPSPERGIAMALAGNGRWCWLDPKLGAMHAVAEAARKVACTGATPVAATNCLNFGNPQKPEIMAQLSAAVDGIAEACTALGTPVTGGNVSLYNETLGEGIYPTPVMGIVGILDDVTKAVPSGFRATGDQVFFLSSYQGKARHAYRDFGATAHAQSLGLPLWGAPPVIDLAEEAALHQALAALADARLLQSASDLSDGGCVTTFARACFANHLGIEIAMTIHTDKADLLPFLIRERLFSEIPSSVIVSVAPENVAAAEDLLKSHPRLFLALLGTVAADRFTIRVNETAVVDASLDELHEVWAGGLESQLRDEVLA